jgi:hypothetical protein
MGTAQLIWIILTTISGTLTLVFHGKPRKPASFPRWVSTAAIHIGLLYWGGFFG